MLDFIALPARARISLSYTGDKKCEGFLGLRKLWENKFFQNRYSNFII